LSPPVEKRDALEGREDPAETESGNGEEEEEEEEEERKRRTARKVCRRFLLSGRRGVPSATDIIGAAARAG